MAKINYSTIKKCEEVLSFYEHLYLNNGIDEYLVRIYELINKLDSYMKSNKLLSIDLEDGLLTQLLTIFDDDLTNNKLNYIGQRIDSKGYHFFPSKTNDDTKLSFGIICKIPTKTSLVTNGFQKDYLYMTSGSTIYPHVHKDTLEIYRRLIGRMDIIGMSELTQQNSKEYPISNDYNICSINGTHGINTVSSLTVIETFKINQELITENNIKEISKSLILK